MDTPAPALPVLSPSAALALPAASAPVVVNTIAGPHLYDPERADRLRDVLEGRNL